MQKKLLKTVATQLLPNRYIQISESHCGPAVVQMLLAYLGIVVTQEQIAQAGDAFKTIEVQGMRVDQLAQAVRTLAPNAQLWFKEHASIKDVTKLINDYKYPVAVEWQGLFEVGGEETDEAEEDYGHYSIVTHVDEEGKQLVIADPYKDFASQDRIFSFGEFLPRWWDTNEVINRETNKPFLKKDERMLFIITFKKADFPDIKGLVRL